MYGFVYTATRRKKSKVFFVPNKFEDDVFPSLSSKSFSLSPVYEENLWMNFATLIETGILYSYEPNLKLKQLLDSSIFLNTTYFCLLQF